MVDKMPAFPSSVQKVLQLTSNINVSAREIVQVIECDPVLTAKILKVINSAIYGFPDKVNSVRRAVVLIGLNTVKNLALSVAALGVLKSLNKAGFDANEFLLHSLSTAALSRKLAELLSMTQTECSDCFVAGLLHDFGKVIFAEFTPEPFKLALEHSRKRDVPLQQSEVEFIGFNHAQAGELLARQWGFSEVLVNAIADHHVIPETSLSACVYTANQISKRLGFGDAGNPEREPFPDVVAYRFGMPLTPLIQSLGNLESLKLEASAFIQP